MKKTQANFYLEIVMLAQVLMLGATGWTMEHLVSGGGKQRHGEGLANENFLWMGREMWGEIHSTIAVSLLVALTVHLALHWTWIKCRALELKTPLAKNEGCVSEEK